MNAVTFPAMPDMNDASNAVNARPSKPGGQYFRTSEKHSTCPWKGLASYYHVQVDENVNQDAAWYYPEPKEAAKQIKNYVAFWRGVKVSE